MDAKKLVESVKKLYSLPNVYYQIDAAINDPNSSMGQIGAIISEDPALSARLLRLANSAFFNFPSKIDSISKAVSIIGTKQLRDLVLATSVVQLFKGIPGDVINMESFWRHSIACGVCARLLGTQLRENNVETYFVAGLIHDLGSLIMYSKIPESSKKIIAYCKAKEVLKSVVEAKALKFDHTEVGSLLLKSWQLPPNLIEAVACHHKPERSRNYTSLTDAVHISDFMVHALQYGASGEQFVPPLNEKAWERFGIADTVLPKIIGLLDKQYSDAVTIILKGE